MCRLIIGPPCHGAPIEPGNDWSHSRYAAEHLGHGPPQSRRLRRPGRSRSQPHRAATRRDLSRRASIVSRGSIFPRRPDRRCVARPDYRLRPGADGYRRAGAAARLRQSRRYADGARGRPAARNRIHLALGRQQVPPLRQLMTESLLLAAMGGALGFAIAFGSCRLFSSWRVNIDLPLTTPFGPDALVLGFTACRRLAYHAIVRPDARAPGHPDRSDSQPQERSRPAAFPPLGAHEPSLLPARSRSPSSWSISSVLAVRSLQHALALRLGFEPADAVSSPSILAAGLRQGTQPDVRCGAACQGIRPARYPGGGNHRHFPAAHRRRQLYCFARRPPHSPSFGTARRDRI